MHPDHLALNCNMKQIEIFYSNTPLAYQCQKALKSSSTGHDQEVSATSIILKDFQAICPAVSLWKTTMGPPQ